MDNTTEENIWIKILKQTLNDFVHNFIFVLFLVSGVLLVHGVDFICDYKKENKEGNFLSVFSTFSDDFFKKLLSSITLLITGIGMFFYLLLFLQNEIIFSVFIIPYVIVSLFLITTWLFTVVAIGYTKDYNFLRNVKKVFKLLIVKPKFLLVGFIVLIVSVIFIAVPLAYLFISIYIMLYIISKFESEIALFNKL